MQTDSRKVIEIENEGHVLGALYPEFYHTYISFALFLVYCEHRKLLYYTILLPWCSDKLHSSLSLKSEFLNPSNYFLIKVVLANVLATMA